MMKSNHKIDTEYWARYFPRYTEYPDLTFVVKYNYGGALYTNVSGVPMSAPINGINHGTIKHLSSFLEEGRVFEGILMHNKDRYRRISEEVYVKALISGKLYVE